MPKWLIEVTDEQRLSLARILDAAQIQGNSARLLVQLQDAVENAVEAPSVRSSAA